MDLPPWTRSLKSVVPLPLTHAESSCVPPQTPPPSPPLTPCTWPIPSIAPGRWCPPPLSVSRIPSQTESMTPGSCGIPCRLYLRRLSAGPTYKTGRPGYQMYLGASGFLAMQPLHHLPRRGQPGSYPPFHAHPLLRSLYHHHHQVLHHLIHLHSKYGGGERISLCYYALSPKRRPIVSACPCYYRQPPPICLYEPTGPGAHDITFQDFQTPGPVQCVIRLLQV